MHLSGRGIRAFLLFAIVTALTVLSGCSHGGGELLRLPKLPSTYVELQKQLDTLLKEGMTYTAPVSGTNRNQIQFVDLDGDGVDEVLAFLRDTTTENASLHVYIYKKTYDSYEKIAQIGGRGDTFDSVWYPQLDSNGKTAIVLGWKLGTTPLCGVNIFLWEQDQLQTLYGGEYTGITVCDMNGNETDEIVLLRHSSTADAGTASLLSYEAGELKQISTCPLSAGIASPLRVRVADIGDGKPTVTVEANAFEKAYVTDLLQFSGGILQNLLFSDSAKTSILSYRFLPVYSCDIDRDGIVEIPRPEILPGYDLQNDEPQRTELRWSVDWCRYDPNTFLNRVETTYLNISERYLLKIPSELIGNYTVEKGEDTAERKSLYFYRWDRSLQEKGSLLWAVYTLTGEDRYDIVDAESMWEIARTHDTVYAYKFGDDIPLPYTTAFLTECFHIIENEWVYNNWALSEAEPEEADGE